MKIAITGHTAGIGLAIANFMSGLGHDIVGFCDKNGHDISSDDNLGKIVAQCQDVDIFFNNAYHDFQQTKLLYLLWERWRGQEKTIVNISSSNTQRWDHSHLHRIYRTTKVSLDEGSRFLWNLDRWPRIVLVKPCATETARSEKYPQPYKVKPDDMAQMICEAVLETRCRIQEINFEVNVEKPNA